MLNNDIVRFKKELGIFKKGADYTVSYEDGKTIYVILSAEAKRRIFKTPPVSGAEYKVEEGPEEITFRTIFPQIVFQNGELQQGKMPEMPEMQFFQKKKAFQKEVKPPKESFLKSMLVLSLFVNGILACLLLYFVTRSRKLKKS